MKIALLGNMNNNNFALMRYFRDLGEDAHLFLYTSDGVGSLSHFRPQDDTSNYDKWANYIHKLDFEDSYNSLFFNIKKLTFPPSKNLLKSIFLTFDVIIGSGLSASILARAGINLTIYYPSSVGLEYIGIFPGNIDSLSGFHPKKLMYQFIKSRQLSALRKAKFVFNAEMGTTAKKLSEYDIPFHKKAIPMVYNNEKLSIDLIKDPNLLEILNNDELIIFSHAQKYWINKNNYTEETWESINKNTDWLIKGFGDFVKSFPEVKAKLILTNYGPDIVETKRLIDDLHIQPKVYWAEKMSRIQIMAILTQVHISVGEFTVHEHTLWGGTGWESLAAGKPTLQSFNFSGREYIDFFEHENPPYLDVKSANDVFRHIRNIWCDKQFKEDMGTASKNWFNKYNGKSLAAQWLAEI